MHPETLLLKKKSDFQEEQQFYEPVTSTPLPDTLHEQTQQQINGGSFSSPVEPDVCAGVNNSSEGESMQGLMIL